MSLEVIIAAIAVMLTGLGMLGGGILFLVKLGGYVARMLDGGAPPAPPDLYDGSTP